MDGTRRRFLGVALVMTFAAVFFLGGISSDGNVEGDGLETMRGNRELLEGHER